MQTIDDNGSYSIADFCNINRVSRSFVYQQIKSGALKTFKAGSLRRITPQAARDWRRALEENKEVA